MIFLVVSLRYCWLKWGEIELSSASLYLHFFEYIGMDIFVIYVRHTMQRSELQFDFIWYNSLLTGYHLAKKSIRIVNKSYLVFDFVKVAFLLSYPLLYTGVQCLTNRVSPIGSVLLPLCIALDYITCLN